MSMSILSIKNQIATMADAAAARREARRKRILENSHNRLQLISGKSSDESCKEPIYRSPIPDQLFEISTSTSTLLNGALTTPPDSFILHSSNHDTVAGGDGEIANDLTAFASQSQTSEPERLKSPWEKLTIYKYDVVLLSLLVQLLHTLNVFSVHNSYFFVPLIVYIVTKLIWFPTQTNSNIASALLLLNGISTNRVQMILQLTQYVGVIAQDVCIFLFTTICVQSLYITAIDHLFT